MKNVLHVMPEFGLAGAETMCETLCCQLQQSRKYNVFVASLYDFHSSITDRMEQCGIKIFYLDKNKGLDLSIIVKLYYVMKNNDIDIIHTHRYVMQYAIPAAILAGVKVRVHTVHNIATKEVNGCRRIFAKFFYRFCGVIPVCISPKIQNSIIKEYDLSSSQTPIVYNGINLSKCLVKQKYHSSVPFRIVHIGRFNPQKNHGVIIEAAKILKGEGYNFSINLIGGAGDEEKRKQEVIQNNLQDVIFFAGLQNDIYPYLQEADCFILPSQYEGLPVTIIEAMGCGLPIIASSVGGIPDIITSEESGILIKPSANELAMALKRLMNNIVLREKIGRNALRRSKLFSAEQMYFGYNKIYQMYGSQLSAN